MVRTLEEWNVQLRMLGDRGDGSLIGVVKKELTRISHKAARAAKQNATTLPKVRSGNLRGSIRPRVIVSGSEVEMQLGASMRYAAAQEYGGTWMVKSWGTFKGIGPQRWHSITLKPTRFLGRAMDDAVREAKVSVSAAIANALRGERG